MGHTLTIVKRELASYFITPVAYVFIVIFLFLTGIFTFYLGSFFERGMADLTPFFVFHPWLYLFLIPAISMRLWSEERKQGTIELLMTLPIPMYAMVLGKFLAAWLFTAIALALTFPLWITVNYLGTPDNGVILAGYIGSFMLAGAYLAIGAFISSISKNQVISFVGSVVVCLLFILAGFPVVLEFVSGLAPQWLINTISQFSFLTNFESLTKGIIDGRFIVYVLSMIGCFLFANAVMVEMKKAD
ncbi:ABC transporter permease subunit [bacterium]|nr:ABC transporter permease subunit [bacterium]